MIKLTFCLRRRADMTLEDFQQYWRTTHATLVAERAETLGIRRYVQLHTSDLPGVHTSLQRRNGGAPQPYDGVAELWFDSLDDFLGGGPETLQASAELLADEQNFIDLANSPMWLGEENVVVGQGRHIDRA